MFDFDIPVPAPQSRWDFSKARPGASVAFDDKKTASQFARAVRAYNKQWSTRTAPHDGKIRVWITSGKTAVSDRTAPSLQAGDGQAKPAPLQIQSTETDDDLYMVVDYRRGENVTLTRAPEPKPVEVVEPERKRRRRAMVDEAA